MTKEDLIECILAAPDPNHSQLQELTDKLHALVTDVNELGGAVTASDSSIIKMFDEL